MKDCPLFMGFAYQQDNQEFEAELATQASCLGFDTITPTWAASALQAWHDRLACILT